MKIRIKNQFDSRQKYISTIESYKIHCFLILMMMMMSMQMMMLTRKLSISTKIRKI